jgi:ATP-binding protein involved in chromosome partitioning
VLAALAAVKSPMAPAHGTAKLSDVVVSDGKVFFLDHRRCRRGAGWEPVRKAAEAGGARGPGRKSAMVALTASARGVPRGVGAAARPAGAGPRPRHAPRGERPGAGPPGVAAIVAVASGKGGVGNRHRDQSRAGLRDLG